ncbi:uncharacterized protein [Argopecten irradians]|uniref:uncharacterized protein n=1 Tax=Argopecten irradians TaxID=31199 RepID=UPI003722D166
MDLPGLLDHGTAQVLECIPEYRNFIIVIDCSTEIKHTLTDLLRDIQDNICKHGGIFNPTSVLFLLNRMDLLDADPSKVPRETEILKIIQTIWPVVIASQLHMVSCRKMLKGKGHLGGFKDTICNFIELTNRRNLEEHCYWLTKLLEGIAAYFGTGYNWLSFDKCLEGIKEHADHDYKCLQKEIERLLNGKSQFYRNLLEAAKVRKAGLRVLLKTAIQNRLEDTDVYRTLLAALETRLCHNLRRDYESTKDSLVDGLRCGIKKQLKLVEHAKDDNASLENVVVRNEITVAVGRLVMTHLALVQKPIRTIEEEVQFIRHREMDINAVIDYLADWCEKQADIERQQMIQSLKSQSEMRLSIKNTHSMNQTANTSKYRQVSDIADHSVKKLYKIYVEDVLMHEYRGSFEEASKDWYVRYRKGKSPTSGGLPQHTDIYREMTMLRALSEKEKAEQEKKSHFLLLQGTSSLVQEHSHVLAIGMERCDVSLNDVILSLQDEDREIWELDNGRKRTEYALGAVKGLQFMHENGFVHRDVKPHNFLVKYGYDGANDTVKICAIGHTEEMANMQTGYGTRQYCAPEVVTSEAYSFKADIYSLGLVLWEMWYCAKLSCEPGKTPSLEPEPEGVFGGILSQCLQTCPANRPDSSYIIGELEKQLIAA